MKQTLRTEQQGFTLVEILISLALLGVILVALFQTVGGTVALSGSVNATNELIREGQIAQQVINTRLQEACYLFPSGATIQMSTAGDTTKNYLTPPTSQTWTVNTHPIVAMILPGTANATSRIFQFFAYYPIPRSNYLDAVTGGNDPGQDALNDATTWVLLQFQAPISAPLGTSCATVATTNNAGASVTATNTSISFGGVGISGRLLVDYVTPVTTFTDMLNVGTGVATYNFRFQRTTRSGGTIRVGAGSDGVNGKVYPKNLGL